MNGRRISFHWLILSTEYGLFEVETRIKEYSSSTETW